MRSHDVRVHSEDDPTSMRIGYAVYCPQCRSRVFTWIDLLHLNAMRKQKEWLKEDVGGKLLVRWEEEIPTDCDEAKSLNLVCAVHDS